MFPILEKIKKNKLKLAVLLIVLMSSTAAGAVMHRRSFESGAQVYSSPVVIKWEDGINPENIVVYEGGETKFLMTVKNKTSQDLNVKLYPTVFDTTSGKLNCILYDNDTGEQLTVTGDYFWLQDVPANGKNSVFVVLTDVATDPSDNWTSTGNLFSMYVDNISIPYTT